MMKVANIFAGNGVALFPGISLQCLVGDRLMVTHLIFEQGAQAALHTHPNEQITLVISGALEFTLGDECRLLRQGEAVTVPSNILHGGRAVGKTELLEFFTPVRQDLLAKLEKNVTLQDEGVGEPLSPDLRTA